MKLLLLQSSWLASCCRFPVSTGMKEKKKSLRPLSCADTIPCLLTSWSDWSDCSVTCGKGLRTRQRTLKSPVELGDCTEELEQVEKCMLPECRKYAIKAVRRNPEEPVRDSQEVRGKQENEMTLICSKQFLKLGLTAV